jgi:hypothetical protein
MREPPTQPDEMWKNNPEPHKEAMEPDPRSILNTDVEKGDGYLWESHNCKEGWLSYEGELLEVIQ